MKAEEYHSSLRPLEEACRLAQSDWLCIPNPVVGWSREGSFLWKAGVLLRHVALAVRCWRFSHRRHILVREFSSLPLLLVFPLLWPLRKKIFFLIHHNLQWAFLERTERFGLSMLACLGARWALFETQKLSGVEMFRIPCGRNLTISHPVPERILRKGGNPRPVIGVAGYYRAEKGMDELFDCLVANFPDCEVVAGIPNPDALSRPDIRIVNTASDEAYRNFLAQCDVQVQNGAKESYYHRASGPVADAASCGTAAVVPDYPMFRKQVSSPVPVGESFHDFGEVPAVVRKAVETSRAGGYDFVRYCEARSPEALAFQLDEFSRSENG